MGVGIALLVVGIIASILYKTKTYQKFRFFQEKIQEEKKEIEIIKRKSSLLMQQHFSSIKPEQIQLIPVP